MTEAKDPWVFPCQLDLKVLGETRADFADDVITAIHAVHPDGLVNKGSHRTTPSAGGKYLSVTVAVQFADKGQVEAVYAALRVVTGVRIIL
jgi:putative lipoic acid-binding regulatory protein